MSHTLNSNHCPKTFRSSAEDTPVSKCSKFSLRRTRPVVLEGRRLTLLRQKQPVSLLQRNPMSRIFVVRREASRMGRLGDHAFDSLFLERVDSLAILSLPFQKKPHSCNSCNDAVSTSILMVKRLFRATRAYLIFCEHEMHFGGLCKRLWALDRAKLAVRCGI